MWYRACLGHMSPWVKTPNTTQKKRKIEKWKKQNIECLLYHYYTACWSMLISKHSPCPPEAYNLRFRYLTNQLTQTWKYVRWQHIMGERELQWGEDKASEEVTAKVRTKSWVRVGLTMKPICKLIYANLKIFREKESAWSTVFQAGWPVYAKARVIGTQWWVRNLSNIRLEK
jgi:hypothetical protein